MEPTAENVLAIIREAATTHVPQRDVLRRLDGDDGTNLALIDGMVTDGTLSRDDVLAWFEGGEDTPVKAPMLAIRTT